MTEQTGTSTEPHRAVGPCQIAADDAPIIHYVKRSSEEAAPMENQPTGRLWIDRDAYGVTFDRLFPVPIAALWGWVTEPAKLARWFSPVSGDLTVDGAYTIDFGEDTGGGTIQRCNPTSGFSVTWDHAGEPSGLVTVALHVVEPEQTRLVLEHRQLPANQTAGHAAGWHSYLDRLAESISGGTLAEWWPRWEEVIDGYRSQYRALTG